MKGYSFSGYLLGLLFLGPIAFAQSKKGDEHVPAYDQIKPKSDEIIDYDYATPNGTKSVVMSPFNLFDYPPGTVTYLINGKPTSDVRYVKRLLNNREKRPESISIGPPDSTGKRIIKINYERP